MAAIEGKITMTTCEGRPCWVKGRRAIFHSWTDSARPVKPVSGDQDTGERLQKWSVHGLVEYEDGRMEREWPNNIRFADSAEKFDSLAWEQMEARRDAMDGQITTQPVAIDFGIEPVEDIQQDNGQVIVTSNPHCMTCAHGSDNAEFCEGAGYDCEKCTVIRCICKRCTDCDQYEPKGGTV